jgi:hypothetical protein
MDLLHHTSQVRGLSCPAATSRTLQCRNPLVISLVNVNHDIASARILQQSFVFLRLL